VLPLVHVLCAFGGALWLASISESSGFLGLQVFGLDGFEVCLVCSSELLIGLLVSLGQILEVLLSSFSFLLDIVSEFSFFLHR